jgi:HTH-type transcriptional regulator/antitoxin HigA
LHGATFYDKNKIVIGLTLRGKDADKFWFSLFHEIGHILLGHLNQNTEINDEAEMAADSFARDTLIPLDAFNSFVSQGVFSRESIRVFSTTVGIDPGILVGRLQKEGYIKFNWYNDLKTKYALSA